MQHDKLKQSTGSYKSHRDKHEKVQKEGKAREKPGWTDRSGKRDRPAK